MEGDGRGSKRMEGMEGDKSGEEERRLEGSRWEGRG